jgi:hypothetical protein
MLIQSTPEPSQFPKIMLVVLAVVFVALLGFAYSAQAAIKESLPQATDARVSVTGEYGSEGESSLKVIAFLPIVSELDASAVIGGNHSQDWAVCNPGVQWWCRHDGSVD